MPTGRPSKLTPGKLFLHPVDLAEANQFVEIWHRHHRPVQGHKFSIGCADSSDCHGVIIVGRPVARFLDDGWTLEVTRCCTDGTKNAPSMLYQAAWRAAKAMGFKKLITYTLKEESGDSLKAAGWKVIGERGGGTWNRKTRPRIDTHPLQTKILWEAC